MPSGRARTLGTRRAAIASFVLLPVALSCLLHAATPLSSFTARLLHIRTSQAQRPPTCPVADTPIGTVQGTGNKSPLADRTVTVQGVVVADYEGASPSLRGFYLQDGGDRDPATSDGVFVFEPDDANRVGVGDVVQVTGVAGENHGQTQITSTTGVQGCETTRTVTPIDITLPLASGTSLERYEGMLVRFPQTLYITEHAQLGRFGQVALSSGDRLHQPTNVVAPGRAALVLQDLNHRNRVIVDDDTQAQNPDPVRFGRFAQPLSASNTLRGADTVANITGVLTYTWAGNTASGDAYRLRPIGALGGHVPTFQPSNARPTPAIGGTLKVMTANLLNYFNTFGTNNCANGVGGSATDCRGAGNAMEFARQWPKTVAALVSSGADVIGAVELENDGYGASSAVQDLTTRLNGATAPDTYAFVDADAGTGLVNALGTDGIKVAIIYKPQTVTPVGRTAALNAVEFQNGGDTTARNRPTLAQAFQENATLARFVLVLNHLKSKGGACDIPDAGDGQANCSVVRTNAARLLARWLSTDPTGTRDPDVLIVGDLNAYAREDPVTALRDAGYTNLIEALIGGSSYSFAFDGQWGSLDHALASSSMTRQVTGIAQWHINADEPSVLDYNSEFKTARQRTTFYAPDQFRMSDHDPVIIGLTLARPGTGRSRR